MLWSFWSSGLVFLWNNRLGGLAWPVSEPLPWALGEPRSTALIVVAWCRQHIRVCAASPLGSVPGISRSPGLAFPPSSFSKALHPLPLVRPLHVWAPRSRVLPALWTPRIFAEAVRRLKWKTRPLLRPVGALLFSGSNSLLFCCCWKWLKPVQFLRIFLLAGQRNWGGINFFELLTYKHKKFSLWNFIPWELEVLERENF